MTLAAILRAVLRESRGSPGRLTFFVACLAVGVTAVVGVAGTVDSLDASLRSQSRELLAADVVVDSRRPLPEELDAVLAKEPGIERTNVRELATMAAVLGPEGLPTGTRIAQLKVVDGRFPFYGTLTLDPAGTIEELLDENTVAAAPELLGALGIDVGDDVLLGGASFKVAARIVEEPGRMDFSVLLGPRVFLTGEGLERTQLLGVGNRVRHRALLRLPGNPDAKALEAFRKRLLDELPGAAYLRIETHTDAQPTVRRAMERVERFLALVALLSLVLGGIGVAQIIRSWLAGRAMSVAVLRCLGYRPREILVLYMGHVVLFALVGSAIGCLGGVALQSVLPSLAGDLLPVDAVNPWQPWAIARGLVLGVSVAVLFALPPLTALWQVSPARVLRADAEPLPAPRVVQVSVMILLAGGLFAASWIQADDLKLAAAFTGGLIVTGGVLALGARLAMRATARLPRGRLGPYLAHGLAAMGRPAAGTTGAVVALGLGVLTVMGMYLVETRLDSGLRNAVPPDAPSAFMVDIQPDQWDGVRALLENEGAVGIDSVPVVMARFREIDGEAVEERAKTARAQGKQGRSRWVLTREQRLTWSKELPRDNVIVEGELWSHPDRHEVSLEQRFAEDLGVGVGSTITLDVQGVPMELLVSSIRTVEWQTFGINFFFVVEPGVLDDAPQFRIAVARLEEGADQRAQDRLAAAFPNVTLFQVRPIVDRVAGLLRRIASAVRLLGAFTIVAGIVILAGAVSATTLRRSREAALLKTLGVTRFGVARLLAAEYGACGLVAGVLGGAGALALSWGFLEKVAELPSDLPWLGLPLAALLTAVGTAFFGVLSSGRALAVRPMEALR